MCRHTRSSVLNFAAHSFVKSLQKEKNDIKMKLKETFRVYGTDSEQYLVAVFWCYKI
jgi:hypothetical protein